MPSLPAAARGVLQEGVLCYVASFSPAGPHLTPVVFVEDGGRLWLTTSRRSAKARAWRRDRRVAGLVRAEDRALAFRGVVRTYDALDLSSWPAAAVAGPRLARAATRFSLKNARFFAGYAVDASRVPFAWTPPGRVFAAIRPTEWALLGPQGVNEAAWRGAAPKRVPTEPRYRPAPKARSLDRGVPEQVRRIVGARGEGTVAVCGMDGSLTVLPARWRRVGSENRYDAAVRIEHLRLAGPPARGPSALAIDRASSWRASEMAGMLLQGEAELFAVAPGAGRSGPEAVRERLRRVVGRDPLPGLALIRLEPRRVVWWDGWVSGTVTR